MTRKEALKILELDDNFTEEELRISYKKQMRKWHPDICDSENSEEMAKKINEARTVLNKKIDVGVTFSSDVDVEELKDKIINILIEEYLAGINSKEDINNYDFITKKAINSIIFKIEVFEGVIKKYNSSKVILNAYKICDIEIETVIRKYILEYCIFHSIEYNHNEKNQILVNGKVLDLNNGIVSIYEVLKKEKKEDDVIDKIEDNTSEFISKVKTTTQKTYDKTKCAVDNIKNKVKKYVKH